MPVRWQELSSLLINVSPSQPPVVLLNENRRWELVSAYQKSVRRADVQTALKVVSAFDSMPQHRAYLWRRLLTTAGEDVGLADPVLVAFALYCYTIFSKASPEVQQHVLAYLTVQMCNLKNRSRVWCSLCVISEKVKACTTLSNPATRVVQSFAQLPAPQNALHEWLRKKSWLTEGMSKYVVLDAQWHIQQVATSLENSVLLHGLPSYAYDMHTRVGRRVLAMSCELPEVSEFLKKHAPRKKLEVLGWALFYIEGARIKNELLDPMLLDVEQEVAFMALGLNDQGRSDALHLMCWMVSSGKLDELRKKAIIANYGRV